MKEREETRQKGRTIEGEVEKQENKGRQKGRIECVFY